jgi:hypothetical protein
MEELAVAVQTNISNETLAELSAPSIAPVQAGGFSFSHIPDGPAHLPPKKYWLVDPFDTNQKIATPVNELGLIQPKNYIETFKATIHPDYEWSMDELSVHHMFYSLFRYGLPSAGRNALSWRDLPPNKVLVPRMFENWIHEIGIPPDVPSEEVQKHQMESWLIARSLFKSVKQVVVWEKRSDERASYLEMNRDVLPKGFNGEDIIGRDYLSTALERNFKGLHRHHFRLETVAPEFQFIEPEPEVFESKETRRDFSKKLGAIVLPRAVPVMRLLDAA